MLPKTTLDLVRLLSETDLHLRKLSLVNASINKESMPLVSEMVRSSKHLQELDISYNGLSSVDMAAFVEVLADNKRLQMLNLQMNTIGPMKSFNPASGSVEADTELENEIMANLGKFMKHNAKLIHLNISHTNLNRNMMLKLGPILRRARSLLVVHASGNPGLGYTRDPEKLDELR